jgi:hypothetical protein
VEELDNADKSKYFFHGLGAKWLEPEKLKTGQQVTAIMVQLKLQKT